MDVFKENISEGTEYREMPGNKGEAEKVAGFEELDEPIGNLFDEKGNLKEADYEKVFTEGSETDEWGDLDAPVRDLAEESNSRPLEGEDNGGFVEEHLPIVYSRCPIEGHGGHWEGERGDSRWDPERETTPTTYNPNEKTWGEILDEHGIDGVDYKDGEPDFSDVSKGDVKIDDFTDDRDSNFSQADEKLAEQKGCSPEDVKKWRKENGYTWHECGDCESMQKVPSEVHNNMPHSGGISEYKKRNSDSSEG